MDSEYITKEIEKRRRERELIDFKNVLSTESGQRVIWRLLKLSGFFNEQFNGNSKDFYQKGLRALGGVIHHEIIDASNFAMFDKMQELERIDNQIDAALKNELESEE